MKKKITYAAIRKIIIQKCKDESACQTEFKKLISAKTEKGFWEVIKNNAAWSFNHGVISVELFKKYDEKKLNSNDIYYQERHDTKGSLILACGSSTVKAYDSSTVKAYDSSTVEAYGSSTVKAYGSSTVEAYGSSTVKAYGSSTVKACGSSTVKAYDSSTVKAYGSSTVKAYDSSTVEAYDLSTVLQGNGKATLQSDKAIIRMIYTNKIYIKKGSFEIIEL